MDDIVLIGEKSWKNLWIIKALFRSFKLMSGLWVNLSKSKLFWPNRDSNFLQATASFCLCGFGSIPFVFLGIPNEINPRRKDCWAPIVSKIRRRLVVWPNRFLSIEVWWFFNSILSNILIFFSFYKAPKVIIKRDYKDSKNFLMG